ncbi:c-type cytochrome [Roseivivax isoporae]|uniref:Cytochrome c domain-containing protein n=1 Tax=Roseivivax isoporae LMG 25204 TaxID=1449351 RepID=X7FDZ9_9RHOB|nr:c-type cytochrome [Roseivivax isoporae]ETX30311.1 hypothetical protein RISW2_15865 [Roseivivax isoporae LMG 25204]
MRAALALVLAALSTPLAAEGFRSFAGHGGPVMDIAVSGDRVLTGSFDYAVGLWPIGGGDPRWLDGHRAAVVDVAFLGDGHVLSAGDDFTAILWDLGTGTMVRRFEGHQGKVTAVRPSPDGTTLATASWDGTIRLWDIATGAERAVLDDHEGNVNDVAWSTDGTHIYSAGYDGLVLDWDVAAREPVRRLADHGFGVNVLARAPDGTWLAYGGLDGGTRILDLATGETVADLSGERRPVLALAVPPAGDMLAIGDGEGHIMVVGAAAWNVLHDFRAAANGPIWALAFTPDGSGVIAGGIADEAFLWPLAEATSEAPQIAEAARAFHTDPAAVPNGERQFLRKCSVCHTLGPDGARRAGPSLAGVFGRAAGSLPGYPYSDALRQSDIVWTAETIDALFALGPDHVTPGSKMPMQQIARPEDRADLIDYLRQATAAN